MWHAITAGCLIETQKKLFLCTTKKRTKNAIFIFTDDIFCLRQKAFVYFCGTVGFQLKGALCLFSRVSRASDVDLQKTGRLA